MGQWKTNKKWTTLSRCRNPMLYVLVLLLLLLIYVLNARQVNVHSVKFQPPKVDEDTKNGFLIRTIGCRIPVLDPFDATVRKYVNKVKPFDCGKAPLVTAAGSTLYIDVEKFPLYNLTSDTALDCCYQPFWRAKPLMQAADNFVTFGECVHFHSYVNIQDEFVKVVCKMSGFEIYRDFYSFVPRKSLRKDVMTANLDVASANSDALSVLILGLDAVSRLNLERQMPRARRFLLNRFKAIEMLGYNKVGDNTFPNLMPILTGLSVEEMQRSCWPHSHAKFDKCPFVWSNFSRAGYLTAYAEDSSWMGAFNYVKRGFQFQPTDYYWRTFNYIAEKEIGHNRPYNAHLCLGSRPVYLVLLDYLLKFVRTLHTDRYFGFFWSTSLSHDDLNYPSLADDHYVSFFKALHVSNALNRTAFIFLSDHGIRWGGIRTTFQGQLEERLPFAFVSLPRWFKKKYVAAAENLKRNAHRLTTPFDLHETLLDLMEPKRLEQKHLDVSGNARGISLFASIPKNRTCVSAGIAAHWCTCQSSVPVALNSSVVIIVANFIVGSINTLLAEYEECAPLALDEVLDARLLLLDNYLTHKDNSSTREYTLIVRTVPGPGLFEATVRCDESERLQLTGTVSRLNLYGEQSACMTNYHLKLYCYCQK